MADARGGRLPGEGVTFEFLSEVIEQLPHPVFVKSRDFRYVLVNDALMRMVGYSRDAVLGRTDYDFLPKEIADFYREKDVEVFASGAAVEIAEEVLVDATGERRILSTRKAPMRGADRQVEFLVGAITDITRTKAVEDALRIDAEELERRVAERTEALKAAQDDLARKERLAVLGRLAGGVAHEIRNPLAAIKNAAYVVQRSLRTGDPRLAETAGSGLGPALEIIHEEVQRANQIITDLLDYARIRVPLRQPTSITVVIEKALAGLVVPPTIDVVRELNALPDIPVDPDQLQGALFNLLRNAIEAMPDGGTLTVGTDRRGAAVVVTIADSGGGIPSDVRARLFEPLITTKPLGLGLGLVTARTLIEGQGGSIECVASDGDGTRFEVTLPGTRAEST